MTGTPAKRSAPLWLRVTRSAAVIILLPLIVLYFIQDWLLYYPDRGLPALSEMGLPGVEEVEFKSGDGTRLVSWWRPPKSGRPTLLLCQGNAGNISDRRGRFRDFEDAGWGVLMLGYRGYGKSDGKPSEKGIYLDTRAALAWLRARPGVDAKKLVYFGESLGCAFASELAAADPPAAVILEAPFRNLKAIADVHYPFLPTSILVRGSLDNVANLKRVSCPVFVAHGRRDEVVPFEHGRAVYEAAASPLKTFYELDSYHNDMPDRGGAEYNAAMRKFVEEATK